MIVTAVGAVLVIIYVDRIAANAVKAAALQPTTEDHAVMGPNLMSTRNRNPVIQTAIRTVREQFRAPEVQELLRVLPPGPDHKIREPEGPPSTWPETLPGARRRKRAIEEPDAEAV